jgi:UDP-glucose 4-epimerase
VREIAEIVREGLGLRDAVIEYGSGDRGWPGDVPSFAYDTSKLRGLGWVPKRTSREAVERAVAAEVLRCKPSS